MQQVGIRELNQNTGQVIERVRRGEPVEITDRGRPVARLVPAEGGVSILDRLVAQGRAVAPSIGVGEPMPMPPILGDPTVDSAMGLVALWDERTLVA
jgi:prevent-host-death family protein